MTSLDKIKDAGKEGDFSSFGFSDYFDMFAGVHTIQTFDDKGTNQKLAKIFHFNKLTETMSRRLQYMNADGVGVYMSINETDGKGRCAANVKRVRAVFADLDGAPLDPTLEYNPSLIVESSPGRYHAYWFTTDTPLNGFTALQKNIIRMFKSDNQVHDLSRVLRIPGFYHMKKKPFLSRVCGGSGEVFSYRDLVNFFPPEPVPQWSAKRYQLIAKGNRKDGEFRGKYGDMQGNRDWNTFRRCCGMIGRGCKMSYVEAEARKEGAACIPPLTEDEIQKILKSASKYVGK